MHIAMRMRHLLAIAWLSCAGLAQAAISSIANELVQNHRRLVVLSETAPAHLRGEARRAGHYLFVRNQHLIRDLVQAVQSGNAGTVTLNYREFTQQAELAARAEGDQLVLRAPLQALLGAGFLQGGDLDDVQRRLRAVGDIRRRFGADVEEAALQAGASAGKVPRPLWDAYVRTLTSEFSAERIIARLDDEIFGVFPDTGDFSEAAARARFLEWDGTELPPRTVLLTFDDGPHATYTPRVLDILKAHGLHAIFFMVGRNLGVMRDTAPAPGANLELVRRVVAEGHAVGNHSYSHPVLPKLDNEHLRREVEDTQRLIETMAPPGASRTRTMRPPFGARNDRVLAEIDGQRLRSVMWNIDSLDWADPIPESIVRRVVREIEKEGSGIILMHDIQARAVDALPRIITELKQRGYAFLRWDGARLVREAVVEGNSKAQP